jgi:hypothetical protein
LPRLHRGCTSTAIPGLQFPSTCQQPVMAKPCMKRQMQQQPDLAHSSQMRISFDFLARQTSCSLSD